MNKDELEALYDLREFQSAEKRIILRGDHLVCECRCVTVDDIKEALDIGNRKTVDLEFLEKRLGLGTGCSSCLKNFDSWKDAIF